MQIKKEKSCSDEDSLVRVIIWMWRMIWWNKLHSFVLVDFIIEKLKFSLHRLICCNLEEQKEFLEKI